MTLWTMPDALLALVKGFILCASLIIAIGPQNLFILQQGLHRRYLLATALLSTVADFVLIGVGVGGLGTLIAANQTVLMIVTIAGVGFLISHGVRSLCAAWCRQRSHEKPCASAGPATLSGAVFAILGFAFLNPAAYVDTLLMIGATGGHYPVEHRFLFGAGAGLASALWFFSLTYGASRLAPIFHHPLSWRLLDAVSGCLMFVIAGSLCITFPFPF